MAAQGRRTLLLVFYISLLFCLPAPVYAQTQHDLVINVIPSDGGTVKADCTAPCQYNADAWAHLLAIPNSGYVFNYWDVDCTGSNPSFRVMMTGPKTCNANFLPCNTVTPFKMGASYYGSFLEAYKLATGGETIDVLATSIQESLRLDRLIPVTLKGGYRCWEESTPSSYTLLQGQMIFKEGVGTVENLMILSGTPPVITSFEAIPESISSGGSSTLHWIVADATSANIDPVVGDIDPINGAVNVYPSTTTIYTLTAINSYGFDTKQLTVTVTPPIHPKITTFTASPDVVSSGQGSMLTWVVTDATTVSIDQGIGTVSPRDTLQVSPASTTVYTITAVNGSVTVTRTVTVGVIPLDPAVIAPAIDQTVATTLYDASSFLYTGSNPIQTGMAPETIEPKRVAVLKGKVMDRENSPLPGVTITILNHPEFGQAITRPDGMFDIAVNGGGYLTLNYRKTGYLTAQRQMNVPWQDYVQMPEVIMTLVDSQVTTIDLLSPIDIQVARGSVVIDDNGTRQATLLIPSGTTATLVNGDGTTQEIMTLSVRATEYTIGPNGPKAMPAELPPTSGYTYCVELSADEAISAGANTVQFSQPLINYVENYLNAAVGSIVPAGYYDRSKGTWIPSENGRVIKILSVSGGQAQVDTDGDDLTDNILGMSDAELKYLATHYSAGETLWRVPVMHFTPWDYNWGYGPPPDAVPPEQNPNDPDEPHCENGQEGSVIKCQSQTLGEVMDITGTPFSLHYQSNLVPGNKGAYTIEIPLSGDAVPNSLTGIELEIHVAGRTFNQSLSRDIPCLQSCPTLGGGGTGCTLPPPGNDTLTNQTYTFTWDGVDAYGRTLQGNQPVTVRIGYSYCGVYMAPAQLENSFAALSGVPITGSRSLSQVILWQDWAGRIGPWDARGEGLGGWTLNVHHAYEPLGMRLYMGNGDRRSAKDVGLVIKKVAGTGGNYFGGDGGPANDATLSVPTNVLVSPDGSLYISDSGNSRIRRVAPDGIISTVAGSGVYGFGGDGGEAINAQFRTPRGIALGPDGSLYIADNGNDRIRWVGPDGIITTIAGTGVGGYSGDGGPAMNAKLWGPIGVAVGPDGSLYVADSLNDRIRRIGTDGMITTVAGTVGYGYNGDGIPAKNAKLNSPTDVAVGLDGSFYIADSWNHRIRRVGPDGIITTVAGNGVQGYSGDGGPGKDAQLYLPVSIAVGPDGSLYMGEYWNYRIRRVGPDGIITTMAGKGVASYSGDDGPPRSSTLQCPDGVAIGPNGSLFLSDCSNHRVRQVWSVFPEAANLGEISLPSEDGSQIYFFSSAGRHLRTINSFTSSVLYQFAYDTNGFLATITDGDGNVTSVEHDSDGNPKAIVGPYGQRTTLILDANGYLASVANPASESSSFQYTSEGLITKMTTPRGYDYTYTYDALGRLTKDEDPAGGSKSLSRAEITNGYQVAVTTAMGHSTNYSVENLPIGEEHRVNTYPDGTQEDTLDRKDGSSTVILPDGTNLGSLLGPDPRFGMQTPVLNSLTIAMPSNLAASYATVTTSTLLTPDNPLTLTSLKDEVTINGRKYTTDYTASTKTVTETSPASRQVTLKIDNQSRVVEYQIAGVLPIQFTYDTQGRLTSETQGAGSDLRQSTFLYNLEGFVQTSTNPLMQTVSFEYDQAGRMTREVLPDGRQITYTYDANGNMTSLTPPGRPAHVFTYNPVDQIAEYNPPDIGIGTVKTEYSYNVDRQLTQLLRPDGVAIDLIYDSGGRLSAVAYPGGPVIFTYDPVKGYLTQINSPGGNNISYAYDGMLVTSENWAGDVTGSVAWTNDANFRITGISINGGNTSAYQYDSDSLLTKAGDLTLTRSAQNGFLTGSTLGNVTDAWTYNSFGQPASYTAKYGTTEIFKQQFTYDKLDRIVQKLETVDGVTVTYEYVYDSAGRLTQVKKNGATTGSYTYDSNDNRLSYTWAGGPVTGIYDNQDRLIQYGVGTYSYTADGELQSRTIGGQTTLYNYDVFGNLQSVSLPGGTLIEYAVDGQNRRLGKKVNGAWVRKFLYSDNLKPIAELDASNNVISVFIYGSRYNTPDYMIKGGITYRIIADHLGSPRLVVNTATGDVVQRMDYDEFGNVTNDTNFSFQPFGFAGGLYDHQTKLIRFGARDYDAEVGRWTAKDPILFAGDQKNLYAYVGNDPVNQTDVFGTIIFGGGGQKPEVPTPNSNIRPPQPTEPPPPPPPPKKPRRPPPDLRGAPGGTWGLKCVPVIYYLVRQLMIHRMAPARGF